MAPRPFGPKTWALRTAFEVDASVPAGAGRQSQSERADRHCPLRTLTSRLAPIRIEGYDDDSDRYT